MQVAKTHASVSEDDDSAQRSPTPGRRVRGNKAGQRGAFRTSSARLANEQSSPAPVHPERTTWGPGGQRREDDHEDRHPPRVRGHHVTCELRQQRSPRTAPRPTATSTSRSAPTATRSTRASRRFWTPVAGSRASRRATASARRSDAAPSSCSAHGAHPHARVGAVLVMTSEDGEVAELELECAGAALLAEHAELERRAGRPGGARRPGRCARKLSAATPSWRRSCARVRELDADPRRPGGGARAGRRGRRRSPSRPTSWRSGCPQLEERLTELLLPRDPHDGSDVVLEIKSGEGGEESRAVRRRPAADVPALRGAARLEDRGPRRHRVRSGRLQGRHGRGEVARATDRTACGRG